MKRDNINQYSEISSLEEIKLERKRLLLKGRLLESKISLDIGQVRETLSLATVAASFARSFLLPKVSDLIGAILKRVDKES